jgi:hypothetical protein
MSADRSGSCGPFPDNPREEYKLPVNPRVVKRVGISHDTTNSLGTTSERCRSRRITTIEQPTDTQDGEPIGRRTVNCRAVTESESRGPIHGRSMDRLPL